MGLGISVFWGSQVQRLPGVGVLGFRLCGALGWVEAAVLIEDPYRDVCMYECMCIYIYISMCIYIYI